LHSPKITPGNPGYPELVNTKNMPNRPKVIYSSVEKVIELSVENRKFIGAET